jgi:LysR family transcriptional activator of nhaA
VEIILRSGSGAELYGALEALHLDVVLTNQPPAPDALSNFKVRELDAQEISLIGTPELGVRGRAVEDYLATSPVVLPTAGSALRMEFDTFANRIGTHPQIAAEVDDMAMMRLLVREGVGFAPLPPIVVRDELARGELIEYAKLPGLTERFYGVTVERRFPNPILADLMKDR